MTNGDISAISSAMNLILVSTPMLLGTTVLMVLLPMTSYGRHIGFQDGRLIDFV